MSLRDELMLDPGVAFLNHGSFGALPRPVSDRRRHWQERLEGNPIALLSRELRGLLDGVRERLAASLGVPPGHLALAANATTALNLVARSLTARLSPGDEVLASELEYAPQLVAWRWYCERAGARLRTVRIPLPLTAPASAVDPLVAAIGERTRIVLLSHITSATALRMPVEQVCSALRERGVLSVIDGAHAPGHVPVEPARADVYVGDLHKWQIAPRGCAFLCASPEHQRLLEPLVISHGGVDRDSPLASRIEWSGSFDPSAWLSIPAALDYHAARLAPQAGTARSLLAETVGQLSAMGFTPTALQPQGLLMSALTLPGAMSAAELSSALLTAGVEAQVEPGPRTLRVSVAWYTEPWETQRLLATLASMCD